MSLNAQPLEIVPSFKCSILSHTLLTHTLHNITISKPEDFTYKAGQYIRLYLDDGTFRLYSIANAPHHPYFELHIQEPNQDNFLKSFLLTLENNQILVISEPMGRLVFPPHINCPILLIAGGYAFAPLKAILEDLYMKGDIDFPVHLYWSISTILDMYHHNELEKIKNDVDWFDYKLILSDFDNQGPFESGNLEDIIFRDFNSLEDFNMYVCGSKNMVKGMYDKALQNNLVQSNFYSDYCLDD